MLYCPNCSAYQHDPDATVCRKCGFDLSRHEKELLESRQKNREEEEKKIKEDLSAYNEERPCPICGSPTREVNERLEIPVEGERIPIKGLKLMGGEITKMTLTLLQCEIKGLVCSDGHRIVVEMNRRSRPLCPLCQDAMISYGSSLLSCSRCNKHFPVNHWTKPDPEKVLMSEGWTFI